MTVGIISLTTRRSARPSAPGLNLGSGSGIDFGWFGLQVARDRVVVKLVDHRVFGRRSVYSVDERGTGYLFAFLV